MHSLRSMEIGLLLTNFGLKSSNLKLHKVAILGAGALGTQIAALFADFAIKTYLFDSNNQLVCDSLKQLINIKPLHEAYSPNISQVIPANYEQDLGLLLDCDLIIESVVDQLDWKLKIYNSILPFINSACVLVTTTSNISINKLAAALPDTLKSRFLGVHFFIPVKFMNLLEITPSNYVTEELVNNFSMMISQTIQKNILRTKDTCNLIANRIQAFTIVSAMHHAKINRVPPDVVDHLTGTLIERSPTATFKTLDLLGLDVFQQITQSLVKNASDDPWINNFSNLSWINTLIMQGNLGLKTGSGIYKYQQPLSVYDPSIHEYRLVNKQLKPAIRKIFDIPSYGARFEAIRKSKMREIKMLWHHICDVLFYVQYHTPNISHNSADIDLAMKWGFGWQKGPFELWDDIGWDYMYNCMLQEKKTQNLLPSAVMLESESL
jgi:3-hydroxyacyl-CoA dehydrogenase